MKHEDITEISVPERGHNSGLLSGLGGGKTCWGDWNILFPAIKRNLFFICDTVKSIKKGLYYSQKTNESSLEIISA